jgi:hypothetical protein
MIFIDLKEGEKCKMFKNPSNRKCYRLVQKGWLYHRSVHVSIQDKRGERSFIDKYEFHIKPTKP